MKKIIALLLAVLMVLSMVACASKTTDDTPADTTPADTTPADTTTEDTEKTDEPADTTTDAEPVETDGEYAVAMITDYGDITDQSFNQTTYEACKAFCEANGITFNYFKPAGDNTADRVAMIEKAVDEGYNVIVMPGYAFGGAIVEAAPEYKDVKFVALDVGKGDLLDSQFTLAHEMGHALHSYLSNHTQPTIYQDYVIFVAEVASTCNEALLMQHLLKQTTDKRQRAYLINYFLEQFRTTLYRQTMFAEFELRIAELSRAGQTLTADLLCEEYRKLNEAYYGPDVVLDENIALEWARIPHFYYNYYVFQYATGYSAAIALSQRILAEGEPAVRDYLGFLSGGCSKTPIELLRGAGVDMTTPQPVESALKLFGELLDEMEALLL